MALTFQQLSDTVNKEYEAMVASARASGNNQSFVNRSGFIFGSPLANPYGQYQRRKVDTSVSLPADWSTIEAGILSQYNPGQEAEALGALDKGIQEAQMNSTFGQNWRDQAKAQTIASGVVPGSVPTAVPYPASMPAGAPTTPLASLGVANNPLAQPTPITPNAGTTPTSTSGQAPIMQSFNSQPAQQSTSNYTGVSIVDYLSSIKQPNDFASRKKLAEQNGITGYSGTAEQNTQLLNTLRGSGETPATEQPGASGGISGGATQIPLTQQIEETKAKIKTLQSQIDLQNQGYTVEKKGEATGAGAGVTAEQGSLEWAKQLQTDMQGAYQKQVSGLQQQITDLKTTISNGASVYEGLKDKELNTWKQMTIDAKMPEMQAELVNLNSKVTAAKTQLDNLPEDVRHRVNGFLVNQEQLQRITAAEAAPLTKLYNALANASNAKASEIEQTRQQVNDAMGYVENDIKRTEVALQWGIEGAKSTADLQAKLDQAGVDYSKSAMDMFTSYASAVDKLTPTATKVESQVVSIGGRELLIDKNTGATIKDLGISPTTATDKTTAQEQSEILRIQNVFSKAPVKGSDGYVDPYEYIKQRQNSTMSPTEFDNRFGSLVNPASFNLVFQKNNPGSTTAWETDAQIWEQLALPASNDISDEDKAKWIKSMGRNPVSFGLYGY